MQIPTQCDIVVDIARAIAFRGAARAKSHRRLLQSEVCSSKTEDMTAGELLCICTFDLRLIYCPAGRRLEAGVNAFDCQYLHQLIIRENPFRIALKLLSKLGLFVVVKDLVSENLQCNRKRRAARSSEAKAH